LDFGIIGRRGEGEIEFMKALRYVAAPAGAAPAFVSGICLNPRAHKVTEVVQFLT